MTAVINDKKQIAQDTLMVEFSVEQQLFFKAGQYLTLTLAELNYSDARGNSRIFSIVNSPTEAGKLAIATRLTGSGFKKTLAELPLGAKVSVNIEGGDFILPKDTKQRLAFIAGGIGITPFMSMISYSHQQNTGHNIILIYSNRKPALTAYKKELEKIDQENENFKVIFTMTDDDNWAGERRKIDAEFIGQYTDTQKDYYMVAGPPQMVQGVVLELEKAGVADANIKSENFSGYN